MNSLAPAGAVPLTGPSLDNKRVAAALIDLVVLFFFGFLLGAIAGSWSAGTEVVVVGWVLYYYFALELLTAQTVGKKAMGLKVVRVDGGEADMRAIAIRTVLRLVDGLGGYVVGLIVMLATGERRQRLGDLAAGTVVALAEESFPEAGGSARPSSALPIDPLPDPERTPARPVEEASMPVAPAAPLAPVHPEEAPEVRPFEPFADSEEHPEPPPAPADAGTVPPPAREQAEEDPSAVADPPQIKIVSPIDLVMADDDGPAPGPHPAAPGDEAA